MKMWLNFIKETCEYNSINKTYVTMFKSLTLNMIVCNQRKNVIDFNKWKYTIDFNQRKHMIYLINDCI